MVFTIRVTTLEEFDITEDTEAEALNVIKSIIDTNSLALEFDIEVVNVEKEEVEGE